MEIGVEFRKFMIMSGRKCYRSFCNHPFLVGFLCFLFLLYRSFPFLFSLLVSASPILVCTAVLLGILLSFGEPHLPEIEKEERVSREVSNLQTGFMSNSTVVLSRDEGSAGESFMIHKNNVVERSLDQLISTNTEERILDKEDGSHENTPLINDLKSLETQDRDGWQEHEKNNRKEEDEEEGGGGKGQDHDDGEVGEHRYSLIQEMEDVVQSVNGEVMSELVDSHVENSIGVKMEGADKEEKENVEEEEEEEDDDDDDQEESLVSESEHAESSSPDASMADILPMLDELHPLLDREESHATKMNLNGSDATSEHSHKSENGNLESDDDSENLDAENENDENDDDGEEESQAGSKGDASKSAITWTEDDQKNLMDLGTSELERNQRLENLIARRRARRIMAEKNLIDFDGSDLPFNVPSITTTRRNPFDGPDDSYSDIGLPLIPGSAPSVLLPRRNPFDLPYEPNEEKPDLKEDNFQMEFIPDLPTKPPYHNQQRDNIFFRRHESFNVGPSSLGLSRQERQDIKWKPYFVPEHFASEGISFRSFERQSSGMSESKASSVPDTESVTSTVDHEEKRVDEPDESLRETDEMSNVDQVSLLVERGSMTSEDLDDQEIDEEEEKRNACHDVVEITLGNGESEATNQHDIGFSPSHEVIDIAASTPSNVSTIDFDVKAKQDTADEEEKEDSDSVRSQSSSSSVFSEVDAQINEVKMQVGEASNSQINYSDGELRPQIEDMEFTFMTDHHKDPVYDSSPPTGQKSLSFSSDSLNLPMNSRLESLNKNVQTDDHGDEDDANVSMATENREDTSHQDGLFNFVVLADQSGTMVAPESVNGKPSSIPSSPSSVIESIGNDLVNDLYLHHERSSIEPVHSSLSSVVTEITTDIENFFQSEQANIDASNHDFVHHECHETEMDTNIHLHKTVQSTDLPSSSYLATISNLSGGSPQGEHPLVPEDCATPPEEVVGMNEDQLDSDRQPCFDESNEGREPSILLEDSVVATYSGNPVETHDKSPLSSPGSSNYESPTVGPDLRDHTACGPDFGIFQRQISEYYDPSAEIFTSLSMDDASNEGGDDEIKDIDKGFLTELDAVGDFRVKEIDEGSCSTHKGGESETDLLNHSGGCLDLPVLEVRSLEDITMAFRQLHEGADVREVILPSSIDCDSRVQGPESGLPVIEARSLDDIHVVKQPVEDNLKGMPKESDGNSHDVEESRSPSKGRESESDILSHSGSGPDLPILEVRSLEDITIAFRQLHEGANVEEVILPSSIDDKSRSHERPESGLPIIEARSLDDIHFVKKIVEDNLEEIPKETDGNFQDVEDLVSGSYDMRCSNNLIQGSSDISDLHIVKDISVKMPEEADGKSCKVDDSVPNRTRDINEMKDTRYLAQGSSILPVLEVRSIEDVTMAFMQLDEGVEVEEVVLPSSFKDQQDSKSLGGPSSGLPVVDAKSLDDIQHIKKQVTEDNHEEVPKLIMESQDWSVEGEVTQKVKETGLHEGNNI
ncbi:hypothetical protein SAY86_011040 [Trapa natans]|uniref:Far1-related sequence 3 n=1 Tax=Trapa natans TaxID=22666 RepID=A0AAN7LWD5_TRANT|nr:hypothetical protein SAY86_011040 [Trapa natans]